jgi:hypothetical protein
MLATTNLVAATAAALVVLGWVWGRIFRWLGD